MKWKKVAPVLLGCLVVILLLLGLFAFVVWRGCSNGGEEEDTAAPVITNVTTSVVLYKSATITWTTDEAATGQIQYGTTVDYGTSPWFNEKNLGTSHSVTLTGLAASTAYHYK